MPHRNTPDFMQLFAGYSKAYGVYKIPPEALVPEGGKVKGRAATIKQEVTRELWDMHLLGEQSIGIVPINENSQCKFGAIDIDEYPLNLPEINERIQKLNLPLVLCRTKSGGAHLYLFMADFTDARLVQGKLREFASVLGFGGSEVYPRQVYVLVERGDIGQWINIPYFGNNRSDRYALSPEGEQLKVEEFVELALKKVITAEDLAKTYAGVHQTLIHGPPCLNHLIHHGFPEGTRNQGLLNLAVYAKKANPDMWKELVNQFNAKYMDPPLSPSEVQGVIKSLEKREYTYMCKQQPIKAHCDIDRCRKCKFGIGEIDYGLPKMGTLTKVETDPPIWFIEVDGAGRMEMTTEDLQSPMHFQRRCMQVLNIMPTIPKRDRWQEIIQKLLEDVVIIEIPRAETPKGLLIQHLEDFCTSRVQAVNFEEILLGKPHCHDNRHYFRFRDFLAYLDRMKFKEFETNQILMIIKELKSHKHFLNLKGRGVNVLSIPEFKKQTGGFDVPRIDDTSAF